ncbi:MAG: CoA pyrophosphatase [Alphaproteobacteria bacterium]|nr:CoA pyrophosphatase [Alphaproteobacteria bacterium]
MRPRWAAVALVLRDGDVLLVRRAARPGDPWSGDWAFPGGFGHAEDRDPPATARRETEEEVGLRLGPDRGRLPARWIVDPWRRRPVRLVPVLFRAPRGEPRPDPAEVAEARWVPLSVLQDPTRRGHQWRLVRGVLPWRADVRRLDDGVVWGLTGRMLDDLRATAAVVELT